MSTAKDLAQIYQKKTDIEHVLEKPDTYIGSVEQAEMDAWVLGDGRLARRPIAVIPALFKLFDEVVVNARDHAVRLASSGAAHPVTLIEVAIDEATGTITVSNDGDGIDVAMHPEHNVWIPELIFAHCRTSTNYAADEARITGGKNGFGIKVVAIWSTSMTVTTVDHARQLQYVQTYRQNLTCIDKPRVTKCTKKPFTRVVFTPDYARFGLPLERPLSADMLGLLRRRVYDIASVTDKSVRVKLDGAALPVRAFKPYAEMYMPDGHKLVYEQASEHWEFAVGLSPDQTFQQVSFVNGINTYKGGCHVDCVAARLVSKLAKLLAAKKKVQVPNARLREQLFVFVRCNVVNPSFDGQSKECLTTPLSKFGTTGAGGVDVPDAFAEKVYRLPGFVDNVSAVFAQRELRESKKTDGRKAVTVRGIPKLDDAVWAGGAKAKECTLFLCEGDSAKAGIVSGLSAEDKLRIGVYPLKGKMLNVRGEPLAKVNSNAEIEDLKKILGLEVGKTYDSVDALRYGSVAFVTDSDVDGSHIKGLGINFFDCLWPSLLQVDGFLRELKTPILKARRGPVELAFYHAGEYNQWKEANPDARAWTVKYYKGLATSTGKEFRAYIQANRMATYCFTNASRDSIDMAFNKKRAFDRKAMLERYDPALYLDAAAAEVCYEDYIGKELVHFSKYDCDRSIPSVVDGLKPSLRKILFAAFKKGLTSELKVAQLSGYVSEKAGYHHGEESLNKAITGMAQTFVGSNNINLLWPCGQFGTRIQGGKDAGSPRYIYTHLSPITRALFPAADDAVLAYLDDDGMQVEPQYYCPIIPMALVNGASGIGTGFSTDVPSYNPLDVIACVRAKLAGAPQPALVPWYAGFQGTVAPADAEGRRFLIKGCFDRPTPQSVRVTELPVGYWTHAFKTDLEALLDKHSAAIKSVEYAQCTDKTVCATVTWRGDAPDDAAVEKLLGLTATVHTGNMHMFDAALRMKRYGTPAEVVDDHFAVRLPLYGTRKAAQLDAMGEELALVSAKARFISLVLEGALDLRRKTRAEIDAALGARGLLPHADVLLRMPMSSVSAEQVERLFREQKELECAMEALRATSPEAMWGKELDALEVAYRAFVQARGAEDADEGGGASMGASAPRKKARRG